MHILSYTRILYIFTNFGNKFRGITAGKLKNYNSAFGVNKHPGIFFNNLTNGDVVFYMRVTLEGKRPT